MLKTAFSMILAIGLLFASHPAFCQLNPLPKRQSVLLYSFESDDLDGWVGDATSSAGSALVSQNTDSQYVSDGKASLMLDLSGIGGSIPDLISTDLSSDSALDLTKYHAFSLDAYVPADSLNPDNPGGYYQLLPQFSSSDATESLGGRGLKAGWNRLIWDLQDGFAAKVTHMQFATNTDGAVPFTGPIYLDNLRFWPDALPGIHSDERLIEGFDDTSVADLFPMTDNVYVSVNSDAQYLHDGAGSLAVYVNGLIGTFSTAQTTSLPSFDASKATAIHLDVFIPASDAPIDGGEIGFEITNADNQVTLSTGTMGLLTDQWNTIELPLSTDDAAKLTNVTGFDLQFSSDQEWNGPIYLDNLRAVYNETFASTVTLGDLNGDGKVNVQDATISLRLAVGLVTPTDSQKTAGDANKDGKLSIQDTTLILQVAVGLKSGF